jgi:ATP-dependent helicase/nuclease subunit A
VNHVNFKTAANEEQQTAIFHKGGVLLSAGAGSGKTFVLVEHIAYLIWDHHQSHRCQKTQDYLKLLREYLSSIVLMTFTKKAAGELAIRLKKKMQQLQIQAQEEDEVWLWQQAHSCLDSMTVGTIDGFCYKLIAQGFFPGLPPEMGIISDIEASQKISSLYDEWIENVFPEGFKNISATDSFFVSFRQEFVDAFIKIFTTPELRLLWREMNVETMLSYDWQAFCDVVFLEHRPDSMHAIVPEIPAQSKGAWVEKFHKLADNFSSIKKMELNDLFNLHQFFENNKNVTTGPRTDGDVKDFFKAAKTIKDLLKDVVPELQAYEEEGRAVLRSQVMRMLDAFSWIERRYSQIPGYTFADLEYFVAQGLLDEDARQNVSERYRYLIVDEFQDTSRIQFDIIKSVINNDFSRLFCVGDEKQAIYGFRGGELAVFQDCKRFIDKNLNLANNYRSLGNIIDFNNALFAELFAKGLGYEGHDTHPVEVLSQTCPLADRENNGVIRKHACTLLTTEGERISESNMIEAEGDEILQLICADIDRDTEEEICVLYKGLKPSLNLMSGLISKGIGLRAQVKIPYPEDPLLAIFTCLIEGIQLAEQKNLALEQTPAKFFVSNILAYLDIRVDKLESILLKFNENISTIGLQASFGDFLYRCGVANSNHSGNMAEIEKVIRLACGEREKILSLLSQLNSKKYSIEFQIAGKGSVVIMTAHASKGLQFSHVILGGIHANGRRIPSRDVVGKLPGSFKWRSKVGQKKKLRSPQMIMESMIDNLKDFSESKRLFYVACTRAENRLSWIDLSTDEGKELSYNANSWINGIRVFENSSTAISKNLVLFETLKKQMTSAQRSSNVDHLSIFNESSLPMFHLDPLGVTGGDFSLVRELLAFPEMSVTKLATLTQCPRKFYLKHICKLDDEIELDRKTFIEQASLEEESSDKLIKSSAQRGMLVHEAIAYGITHHGVISLAHQKELGSSEKRAVEWGIKKILESASEQELISEKALKFDFFGQMVSGTPDLVILPEIGDRFKIVDFKTGRPSTQKEEPYWFQLKCYAHAVKTLNTMRDFKVADIELWYVDTQEVKSQSLTSDEIRQELAMWWSNLSSLGQVNTNHCAQCSLGKICHP